MTAEQTAELRVHLSFMSKERLIKELINAQDWTDTLNAENMQLYEQVSTLKRNGGSAGRVAQLELDRDQWEARCHDVQRKFEQLVKKARHLSTELDNLRQQKFDAPILCECGCQKVVKQPATGRARHYYSPACRKRAERRRKSSRQLVTKEESFRTQER